MQQRSRSSGGSGVTAAASAAAAAAAAVPRGAALLLPKPRARTLQQQQGLNLRRLDDSIRLASEQQQPQQQHDAPLVVALRHHAPSQQQQSQQRHSSSSRRAAGTSRAEPAQQAPTTSHTAQQQDAAAHAGWQEGVPPPVGGGSDEGLAAAMAPGPLTAAFARLLSEHQQQHTQYSSSKQQQHVRDLLAHAQQLAPQLLPRQASLVLYVVAKLQLQPPDQAAAGGDALQEALRQQLAQPEQLRQLPPAGLVNTLWALAVLHARVEDEWMQGMYAATEAAAPPRRSSHRDAGAASQAAAAAAAAAAGGAGAQQQQQQHLAVVVGGAPLAPASSPPIDGHRGSSSSSGGGGAFAALNHHQLVQLLWALGRLQQRPLPVWLQGVLTALQPLLPRLTPSELANTAWGLARIGFRPSRPWLAAWLAASAASLPRACPDSLACQLASLGVLRVDLQHNSTSGRWLRAVRAAAAQQQLLGRMQPRHVAAIMCGLAKRRLPQPPHWVALLLQQQLRAYGFLPTTAPGGRPRKAPTTTTTAALATSAAADRGPQPRDVAATVWALPLLLYPTAVEWGRVAGNAELLRALAAASLPLLPRCSAAELVQLAVGFARLGFYPGAHWLKVHENAVAAHRLPLTDANRWRLHAAIKRCWADG